ncbi:MAG: Nitroreductase family protein [Promethearchaeota archaeon]|nr:MAG: Nitroreductase family protein [Candidatus Lokiarchaeota archaeon]
MSEKIDPQERYGDYFQEKSKYTRENLPRHQLDWANKPDTYKIYSNPLELITLPEPEFNKDISFWEVLLKRRSIRNFAKDSISLQELSLLLFGMSGITRKSPQFAFRTVPSAGALYPIEIYPVINHVSDLQKGVYHYRIKEHQLEFFKKGDFRNEVSNACLGQRIAFKSAVNFVMTAMIERSKWKYLQRAYRYIYLDAGHIGQNLYLTAEALNLGICTIGAIFDKELNKVLEVDGKKETAVYVGAVGSKI